MNANASTPLQGLSLFMCDHKWDASGYSKC